MSDAPGGEATVTATERWFVGRGLPHFIEDYSASRDVFTRAVPLLALLFVFSTRPHRTALRRPVALDDRDRGPERGPLGAISLVTSYGILPMTRWAVWQTLRQVETVVGLYVRLCGPYLRARANSPGAPAAAATIISPT